MFMRSKIIAGKTNACKIINDVPTKFVIQNLGFSKSSRMKDLFSANKRIREKFARTNFYRIAKSREFHEN